MSAGLSAKAMKLAEEAQSQVANKADKTELANKADKSELADKADTGYVDSEVASVRTQLEQFPRIEVVDTEPSNPQEGVLYFVRKDSSPPAPPYPTDYHFRFDAEELGLSNNDNVAEWEDSSGNGFNIAQGDSGLQPAFLDAGLNGKPTVNFNGTELENTSFTLDNRSGGTIFVVGQFNSTSGSQSLMSFGIESPDPLEARRINVKLSGSAQALKTAINGQETLGQVPMDTSPFLYSSNYDMTQNKSYLNGALIDEVGFSEQIGTANQIILGRCLQTNRLEPYNGKISEMIYFPRSLSESEMDEMHMLLLEKWGL